MLKKYFCIGSALMLLSGVLNAQSLADLPAAGNGSQLEIRATDPTALTGTSSAAFTVIRNNSTNGDLVVKYDIGGTASNGLDYVKIPSSLLIPAGYFASDIVIQALVDVNKRGNKTVSITLETNQLYKLTAHKKATVTLVDDIFNDLPPTVSMTSPANGAVFTMPANIVLKAEASDADDTVQKVSFYNGDDWLGKATNSPFTITWSNAPAGKHTLFARATDNQGKSTLSTPIEIVVTNDPPKVTLLSPINQATFSLPANVEIKGTATDTDDAVIKVDVYGDGRRLGVFTNSPFSLTWSNVPPGKHSLTARASDTFGVRSSASVMFSVTNQAPQISITSPKNGDNVPARSSITIKANATDPDGSIRYVSFYAGSRFLGLETQSPYTIVWKNIPSGAHELRAVAVDRYGARTISAPVTISASK